MSLFPALLGAHEVWLEPLRWRVEPGETLAAHLRNGETFEGVSHSFNPRNARRFDHVLDGRAQPVPGRLGDRPAAAVPDVAPGLHTLVYVSRARRLTYREWDKFARFATHKDFPDIAARHDARGLPREGFVEAYTRFAKALVAVGSGAGADAALGLETELVALDNPYAGAEADVGDAVRVLSLYKGAPRPDAQIELFEKGPDGAVTVTLHRTDADGVAVLPTAPGRSYLVDAVVLRTPEPTLDPAPEAVWETLWASLTFATPPR